MKSNWFNFPSFVYKDEIARQMTLVGATALFGVA
jgi:hypothetical protein